MYFNSAKCVGMCFGMTSFDTRYLVHDSQVALYGEHVDLGIYTNHKYLTMVAPHQETPNKSILSFEPNYEMGGPIQ